MTTPDAPDALSSAPLPLRQTILLERDGPSVVAIGGGHGLAQALQAVAGYAGRVTAIVTVTDDGGSSGRLAPALDIPPPGDIRQCLLALTPEDSVWRRLFEYRFATGDVEGHSMGNLILGALTELEGSFEIALRRAEVLLGSIGSVVPAAARRLALRAEIGDEEVVGQVSIQHAPGRITKLTVVPEDAEASPTALEAIAAADQIVLGPGSLYTSVLAALVVPGLVDEINRCDARVDFVANLITQDAETLGMDGADHLHALLEITGIRLPSTIVANSAVVTVDPPLQPVVVDPEVVETYGVDVLLDDVVDRAASWPKHDPARLGQLLAGLVENDSDPGRAIR